MKYLFLALCSIVGITTVAYGEPNEKKATLDDLKKLDINCFVPSWLPEGFKFKSATIDYSDTEGAKDKKQVFPGYYVEYGHGKRGSFSIESARWGIGDRNLDQDERAEESQFDTKAFGPVYIIYFPPGKSGVKKRITANWVEDATLKAEKKKNGDKEIPIKGRFHGISGSGMTLAEFQKIVQSLHPIREK